MQNIEQKFMMFVIPEYRNNNLQDLKKITWDTALSVAHVDKSSGIDLMRMQQALGSSIKNVFISDRNGSKDWLLPGTSGWGISYLPLESFLMKLKASDYNGFFTLKVKPSELWAGNEEKILQNLWNFMKYIETHFHNFKPN
jgi:sugar phosphate isomerase/epimerase